MLYQSLELQAKFLSRAKHGESGMEVNFLSVIGARELRKGLRASDGELTP